MPLERSKGVKLSCSQCQRSYLEDPDASTNLHPATLGRRFMEMAVPAGWEFTETGGVGYAICPACQGGPYNANARCPMCGNYKVTTVFCSGATCGRGMIDRHLHRVCQRCKYDFIQKTKVDSPAKVAQVPKIVA